jgi:hypothetical protein
MFPEFYKWKTKLIENGNFRLFSANRKGKRQISVCLLQTKTENVFLDWQTINGNQ